ncbi:MAG: redoxin domain-containing protein [Pseudolysinimonas sp.]
MGIFERLHAPSFDGAVGWLNSEPLGLADLEGKVVLANFWTLTCINWLRQEPYVRAWSQAYRDDGLVVVGVHTPEFSFERDADRIRRATTQYAIDYPVAIDSAFGVWEAFGNHYWPALYFIDRDGRVRDEHFGEGRYQQSERVLQMMLGIDRPLLDVRGTGVEAEADWESLRTPETYLGYQRGERFATPDAAAYDKTHGYRHPDRFILNHWALAGEWTVGPENVRVDAAGGSIAFRFHARDAHFVMSSGDHDPIPFTVTLDSEAPGESHGGDIDADGAPAPRPVTSARRPSHRAGRRKTGSPTAACSPPG